VTRCQCSRRLSHRAIAGPRSQRFRSCPLKYWFRYVAGLPEETVSSAFVFGTGIHAAIEDFYRAELAGEAKPDLDALLFAYRSAWLPHDPDKIQFGST
jgi:hypothetical protein